jgi:excisionase family DNA binding protein
LRSRSNNSNIAATVKRETLSSDIDDGLMTVPEAADFLRVSRSSIYQMMERGELSYVKLGKSRRLPRAALKRLIEESLVLRKG